VFPFAIMDKMVTFSYAKYLKEPLLGSFWLGSPRTQKSYLSLQTVLDSSAKCMEEQEHF
jgi:hypothetical protein